MRIHLMQAVDSDGDLWALAPQEGAGPERNLAAVARFETQEFVCRLMPGERLCGSDAVVQ